MKFKMAPKGEVEEVDRNAEFSSGILTHSHRFANTVFIVLGNLYLVHFVSQNIQKVDNLSENFLS